MTITTRTDAMDILDFFLTKKSIGCLHEEGINSSLYNDLFSRGWLSFTDGKRKGLYIEITASGKQVLCVYIAAGNNIQIPISATSECLKLIEEKHV